MAVTVDSLSLETAPDVRCHLLPCTVNKDGYANVAQYFETSVKKENDDLKATFRGRPLNGQEMILPAGYTGLVIQERGLAVTEEQDRLLRVDQRFGSFTAWNLDKPPSRDDRVYKVLQWIEIAKAVHRPVEEESSQKLSGK